MNSRFVRGGLIGLGALIISTLGIFASDSLSGIDSRIENFASIHGREGVCPQGMTLYAGSEEKLCVDLFEASASDACVHKNPKNVPESEKNVGTKGCYAESRGESEPWTYITLTQAQRVCAESGKRLPSNDEWYRIALGTDENECLIDGDKPRVTGESSCKSSSGAFDMVGNVWEWVDETVADRAFHERALPVEGYVTEVDASGVAVTTDTAGGNELYGEDYFWSKDKGVFGMIRGGFYGSGNDAGLYTTNASVPTSFATQGVGFRCVMSI